MKFVMSGGSVIVFIHVYLISFLRATATDAQQNSFEAENLYELDGKSYRVSGDVFIVDRVTPDNKHALQELFEHILETESEVFVKISGNAVSIVTDSNELTDVLRYTDKQRHPSLNIVSDIQEVLQVAEKKVHIYIITEEGSGGGDGMEALTKQLKERNIRIDILHLQGEDTQEYYSFRHRRQINFYQLIANVSGGSVINTNKQNIGSTLNLLKQSIKTSLVHVMRFADHSPAGKEFRIPVDDTMTELIFRAQVERSNPVIIAMTPAGIPPRSHPQLLGKASAGTVVGLLETNLTKSSDYGTWKITKLDFNLWDIKVDGQSSVDFTHEFLEPGTGGFGQFPLKGRPVIGNTCKLSISVPEYSKVQTVAMGMLYTKEQMMPIDMKPLKNVGGRRGKSVFYEQFTIPDKDFMVGIEGRDKSGHMFRRIDPILIIPVGLKLVIPSLTGLKFYQNQTLAIPFIVINQGSKEQGVDVKIEDDKKFAQSPRMVSATIKPGQNFTGTFIIRAGLTVGETTTVTVTAKPHLGHGTFSQGQFEIRRFTVLDNHITTKTSTTRTTVITSTTSSSASVTSSSKRSVASSVAAKKTSDKIQLGSVSTVSTMSNTVSPATAKPVASGLIGSPTGNTVTAHSPSSKNQPPLSIFSIPASVTSAKSTVSTMSNMVPPVTAKPVSGPIGSTTGNTVAAHSPSSKDTPLVSAFLLPASATSSKSSSKTSMLKTPFNIIFNLYLC